MASGAAILLDQMERMHEAIAQMPKEQREAVEAAMRAQGVDIPKPIKDVSNGVTPNREIPIEPPPATTM
jgi:hypothetical protein